MKTGEFIALSACTMMLTALGIDVMLPALGDLRAHFGLPASSTATSNVITFFFLGQMAQIVFGILSDRFGRLFTLRIGFPLYFAGGIAAVFSPSLELMLAARFVAGVGASAVFMTTIAGVRDRFVGDKMAHTMSLIFTIFLFTPVLAPFLGLAILSVASWQAVFLAPPVFAVFVFIWSLRLEESLPQEKRPLIDWPTIRRSVKGVIRNRVFLRYTLATTLLFSALSSWVASADRIVGEIFGRPELFAWIFAGTGLLMSFSSLMNSRLTFRFGAKRTIRGLVLLYTLVAAGLLAITLITTDPPAMIPFFTAIALLMSINLAIEPNSSALAMEPMGETAGLASAVYGTIFFFTGASLGAVISHLMTVGVLPLAISFVMIGLASIALVFGDT
ncbi:MFS transporter [uncultured Imperialibacter sp.]|uniref:MFS transporter n=1 Tax=uncultured Imperialibacter sp. TaxID=1672639 RepID=UPI0030D7AD21